MEIFENPKRVLIIKLGALGDVMNKAPHGGGVSCVAPYSITPKPLLP